MVRSFDIQLNRNLGTRSLVARGIGVDIWTNQVSSTSNN